MISCAALEGPLRRGEASPTGRDAETIPCISLHLWKANRSEIVTAKSSAGDRPFTGEWDETVDIKKISAPDAILCFELSSAANMRHASLDLSSLPPLTLPSIMVTSVNGAEEEGLTGDETASTVIRPEQSAKAQLEEGPSFLDGFGALSDVPEEGLSVEISEKTGVQSPDPRNSSGSVVDGPTALESTLARLTDTDSLACSLHRTIEEVRHLQQRHEKVRSLRIEKESEWLQTLSHDLEKIRSELKDRIQIDERYLEQLDRPPQAHRVLSAD